MLLIIDFQLTVIACGISFTILMLYGAKMQSPSSARNSPRGIFCSRTLNLRSISAIGYDMDYTLMHYNVMVIIFSYSFYSKFNWSYS